jgi:hypothetical protein
VRCRSLRRAHFPSRGVLPTVCVRVRVLLSMITCHSNPLHLKCAGRRSPAKEIYQNFFKKLLQLPLNVWSKIKKMSTEWLNYPRTNYSTLPLPFHPPSSSLFTTVFQHKWALPHHSSMRVTSRQSKKGSCLSAIATSRGPKVGIFNRRTLNDIQSSLRAHSTI